MRIAINALAMKSPYHGMGSYIGNLIHNLSVIDQNNQYLVFVSPVTLPYFARRPNPRIELRQVALRRPLRILWEQIALPRILAKEHIDVFHGPAHTIPLRRVCAQVVTIHDLLWFVLPRVDRSIKHIYFRNMIPASARAADQVITISKASKKDLVQIIGTAPSRITVVYLAISDRYRVLADRRQLAITRAKHRIPPRYILFVGVLERKKNLGRLITAFHRLKSMSPLPHHLVIAGSTMSSKHDDLRQLVRGFHLEDSVHFIGSAAEDDLAAIYNMADLFCLPSLYEGFGIPALEAMACGVPVIVSNVSSLPEIVGDAGQLVDPYNENAIADMMIKVLTDKGLSEGMRRRGLRRAKEFSWVRTAEETLRVYSHVYDQRAGAKRT